MNYDDQYYQRSVMMINITKGKLWWSILSKVSYNDRYYQRWVMMINIIQNMSWVDSNCIACTKVVNKVVLGGINFCSHDYCIKIQHGYHDIVYIL